MINQNKKKYIAVLLHLDSRDSVTLPNKTLVIYSNKTLVN